MNLHYYREVFATLAEDPDATLEVEASMNYWCEVSWQEAFTALIAGTRIRVKPGQALAVQPLERDKFREVFKTSLLALDSCVTYMEGTRFKERQYNGHLVALAIKQIKGLPIMKE